MEDTITIKSIHTDFPEGKNRLRVRYVIGKSNVQKTIEIDGEHIQTQNDIVNVLQQHFPYHKITGFESWQNLKKVIV